MRIGLLWLEGPLQSWGHDSRFGRRSTLPFPTRSGILGMLCCALGREGEQREWLDSMRPCRQMVAAFARNDADQAPLLRDFHMVGAGYDSRDGWEDMFVPRTIEGKHPTGNTGARITWRHYIQDMAFACAMELPESEDFAQALTMPRWPLCLGRRCCVPSDIIWRGWFGNMDGALGMANHIARQKDRHEEFRVLEGKHEGGEAMLINDIPVAFGLYKEYASRFVTVIRPADSA